METSQIVLNQGLTFLVVATGIILILVGGFLIKLLIDLSKLTKNLDETTSIVKAEVGPTLKEFNDALKSISSIAQNADKQVDSLTKFLESVVGASALAFTRAKNFSGGLLKGLVKGLATVIKLFYKK
ncbi:MAG: DUF948 domain-containing protein [Candidatus Gastranaerophilales bacterium]|nr:DUF948 domain-containing protein [Candidatus Gastranaerophilales bacterium]